MAEHDHEDLYRIDEDGNATLAVHAQPGAGRTQITGRHGDALKIRVAAPPEHGRANAELAKVLADAFGIGPDRHGAATGRVELVAGEASRNKRFRISGVEADELARVLRRLVEAGVGGPGPGARDHRRPGTPT